MTSNLAIGHLATELKKNEYPVSYLQELANFLGVKIGQKKLLTQKQQNLLKRLLHSLQQQKPVEYLVGEALFFERRFTVSTDVLIPRFDTEKLVLLSLEIAKSISEPLTILDIGTGSGTIIISLAKELETRKDIYFMAMDISPQALAIAMKNARKYAVSKKIMFRLADTFPRNDAGEPYLPTTNNVLLVSNPPYVTKANYEALPKSVKDYEPKLALKKQDDFIPRLQTYITTLRTAGKTVHCAFEYSNKTGNVIFRVATPLLGDLQALLES